MTCPTCESADCTWPTTEEREFRPTGPVLTDTEAQEELAALLRQAEQAAGETYEESNHG